MKKNIPNFEKSIEISIKWCEEWDKGELSEEILSERLNELFKYPHGKRAFFASALSIDNPIMDRVPESIIFLFRNLGQEIVEIVFKNLVMSSAMMSIHIKNNSKEYLYRSERIKNRCIELINVLESKLVLKEMNQLTDGINGRGKYKLFFNKWGYEDEQITMIEKNISEIENAK